MFHRTLKIWKINHDIICVPVYVRRKLRHNLLHIACVRVGVLSYLRVRMGGVSLYATPFLVVKLRDCHRHNVPQRQTFSASDT